MPTIFHRRSTAAVIGLLAAAATACGGAASSSSSPTATASSDHPSAAPTAPPGVFGSVAAVNGMSLEVQDPSTGQTTVNVTASTDLTQTESATAADVAVGDCVVVTADGTPSPGMTITARAVTVSQAPANGDCTRGGVVAGGAGGGGGFFATRAPNAGATPRVRPSGGGQNRVGFGTVGKVTSVTGSTFVVQGFAGGRGRNGTAMPAATAMPTATPTPTTTTVVENSTTTYTKTITVTPSALAVGQCVVATGPADDTGAVTASTIRISTPGPNGCSQGITRFGGRGAPQAGASANG